MTDLSAHVRRWLSKSALPLWATAGLDRVNGGFVERLHPDGSPDLAATKRLRVQARQIYVYSHAAILELYPGAIDVAGHGYEFVMAHGCPEGVEAGFVHAVDRAGQVCDRRRDTYDHAFLLFALSWFYRATGRPDVRVVLDRLADTIWTRLSHPSGHGFVVDDRGGTACHQNPHMHLFEALLAAHDATGDRAFLDRATSLFTLFRDRMFDPDAGVLREYYDADWKPAAGDAGDTVEPGHHCEWVWLLKWYADRIDGSLCDEAWRLHAFVERHGRREQDRLLVDELHVDGRVRKPSLRSWPQTEAIKAEIAIAEARGTGVDAPVVDALVEALFKTYLDHPVPGGWTDWIDEQGHPLGTSIPASTFYHLFLALSEYLRVRSAVR